MFDFEGKQKKQIGDPGFSRTRKFDDATRKARIFAPKAEIAVDVDKLEDQMQEKNMRKEIQEDERKKFDYVQKYQLNRWNEADEELRKGRIEERLELEDFWRRQDDEFKERWKKEYHVFNAHDPISIVPASRYEQQDEEPIVDAQKRSAMYDEVAYQVEQKKALKKQEKDDYWAQEFARRGSLARLERCQHELDNLLRKDRIALSEEHLQAAHNKTEREKRAHHDEHHYQIHHSFFEQFGTTSR